MSTAAIAWQMVTVPGKYSWNGGMSGTGGTPPALPACVHGVDVPHFSAIISGSASLTITGITTLVRSLRQPADRLL